MRNQISQYARAVGADLKADLIERLSDSGCQLGRGRSGFVCLVLLSPDRDRRQEAAEPVQRVTRALPMVSIVTILETHGGNIELL